MKKIALINQRYGKEVNGGSEYYTMQMAQRLRTYYEVEVLTSKALTYDKWADYYTQDVERIDGITVRRFGVKRKRNRYIQRLLKEMIVHFGMNTKRVTAAWNRMLGPYVPELIAYVDAHIDEYDAFIFITYMYYPVVFGMEKAADKAIFVPTAHDEYLIYFKIYEKIFRIPKKIVYLTEEEKEFVQGQFHNEHVESRVVGMGIELPEPVMGERFRQKYGMDGEYVIYAGRVDEDKGCGEMFAFFQRYCRERGGAGLRLTVIGKAYMDIPESDNIRYLGYVSEQDKYDGIKGAKMLWLPSRFESLSIAALEAMALGVPVVVSGECAVLKGHCERSGAGEWYIGYEQFVGVLEKVLESGAEYGEKGMRYVAEKYRWGQVMEEWKRIIESVFADHS